MEGLAYGTEEDFLMIKKQQEDDPYYDTPYAKPLPNAWNEKKPRIPSLEMLNPNQTNIVIHVSVHVGTLSIDNAAFQNITYPMIVESFLEDLEKTQSFDQEIRILSVSLRNFNAESLTIRLQKFPLTKVILADYNSPWFNKLHPNPDEAKESIQKFCTIAQHKKISVALNEMPIFNSIFVIGENMVVVHHIQHKGSIQSPVTVLHKQDQLFQEYLINFEHIM